MERAAQEDPEAGGHEALDGSGAELRLLLTLLSVHSPTTLPPSPTDAHLSSDTQGFLTRSFLAAKPTTLSQSFARGLSCSRTRGLLAASPKAPVRALLLKLPTFINNSESKSDQWKKMFLLFWFSTKKRNII